MAPFGLVISRHKRDAFDNNKGEGILGDGIPCSTEAGEKAEMVSDGFGFWN
jgi:hypothetical protein